jgi:hypothetical protein
MKTFVLFIKISFPILLLSQPGSFQKYTDSPGINLGPDFNLCPGVIHLLDAGSGYDSYLWQDGSTDQTFMVTEGGTFWVHAYLGSTMYADTIEIGYWPYPDPNLGNDTLLCPGNALFLEPPANFASYLWQNGSTLPFFIVSNEGLYWVTVTDVHGCTASDSIWVTYSDFEINLGMDTSICLCDSVLLDAGAGFFNYEWQDGSTDQCFLVVGADFGVGSHEFSVTAIDSNNCVVSDTILIYIDGYTDIPAMAENEIRVYPNPVNDRMFIHVTGKLEQAWTISIFNALGNQIHLPGHIKVIPGSDLCVETGHLNNGVYLLTIRSATHIWVRKFIINHSF